MEYDWPAGEQDVDLNNITVNAEHKRYKYPEAVEKGLVSAFVWKYDNEGWYRYGRERNP